MMNLEQKAKLIAETAHYGQVRKYTNEPYIHHPAAVVEIVRSVPHTVNMLCAAWLHDVVEDTDVELKFIYNQFPSTVGDLVDELTSVSEPEHGNRAARKALDRAHLADASAGAKTIKLADMIHNMPSVIKHDPKFATTYMAEKNLLLDVLREGNGVLYNKASHIIYKYYNPVTF